ncbi:MAG: RHS repeat protein, partial [Neptuniibacter sp.]
MTLLVGGHETGLLNTSLELLDRNDNTGADGELPFVNVSNGNLVIQQQDVFMPSQGDDYFLTRTYNARGRASDAHQHEDARWTFSTTTRLTEKNAGGGEKYYEIEFGDGSVFDYQYDSATGLYMTTDGAGAYGTVEDLSTNGNTEPSFVLTRADQDRLYFDSQGRLLQLVDTNGVTIDYIYESDRLVQVLDDQGHILNYIYQNGILFQVTDETEGVLVEYHYDSGRLSEVIDRFGHSTQYFYTNDGFLERIVLPEEQVVDGQLETYDHREINFAYDTVNWRGDNKATAKIVTQITNAAGGVTTFDYDFDLVTPSANGDGLGHTISNGKGHFKHGDDTTTDTTLSDNKFFQGGVTTVVDALGNDRAYSNEQQYIDWRTANGFYATYDANQAATDPSLQSQVDAIRSAHALTYTYRADGYVSEVVDQQGFHTFYDYDDKGNLISVTDRNGWGATNSDSDYYRALRAELGYVDGSGNGKLVATLTPQEITDLLEAFTSHSSFDERGNMISLIDNADNETTFVYTSFNKLESSTSAVGNALVTRDEQAYQDRRVELGYAALVADLSALDIEALLHLHTTYFSYDANQNLMERIDAGGDITRYEYDSYGNQTKRIVFLDANDLTDPAKQQVTIYTYDGFGNNIGSTDAEGYQTYSEFDHFGNLTRFTDANGGVTLFAYDADNRLLTVTDPEGYVTVNTYDAVGNRISVTDANGHTVTRFYDLNNNLIAVMDPSDGDPAADRLTQFEYDVVGSRTAVVDAEGRRTEYTFNVRRELVETKTETVDDQNGQPTQYASTFAYDGEGNRITTTNNRGFTTEYLYTQNNLVRQQTDANGHVTRIEYDANNNQISIIAGLQLASAQRQILNFRYDEEDQLITQTDAEGNVTQYDYDAPGNRVSMTDANGHVTEYEYDGNNRLIREILPEVIDPQTGLPVRYTVEHHYDGNGNEVKTIDENGHSTRYSFDKDDRLVMVEDANGIKTVFEYDSRHNRTSVIIGADASLDVDGRVVLGDVSQAQTTRYTYDEFNQLIAQTDGVGNALAESDAALYQTLRQELGYATLVADLSLADQTALRELYTQHYSYDRVGNRITRTDHLDRVTSYTYDSLNRLSTLTDALGQVTGFRYDGNGNRTSQTDAELRTTYYSYDGLDRLTDSADPLETVTHREYDVFGNLISETRASGTAEARTSTYTYDLNNRVLTQTDPEGHTQSYEYDAVGNRLRMIDGRGNATQYVYDALDRNIKVIDPLSFETRFQYDGVGNRISLIDPRGGITEFAYDPGNRLITTTDAEGRITTYAYDVRGNRIEQRTAAGTSDEEITQFEYDAENNLRRVIDAEGGITENDYDQVYNRIAVTDANGHTTRTEFDAIDQVISITDAEGQVTSFTYDAVGNQLTQTDALGRVTTFAYDDNDRLIRQIAADSVETHYAYDLVGNRTQITWAANTTEAATDTFVYDLDDRLVSQTDAEGNVTSYAYDENHNRTSVTDPNGNITVYTYDENNRVVQIDDPEANTVRYVYDGNGNRIQVIDGRDNASSTFFNANNEVILTVDAEGYASSFNYDNNGNLLSQTLYKQPLSLPVDPAAMPTPAVSSDDQTTAFEYDKLNRVTARIDAEGYRTEFVYDAVGNQLEAHQFVNLTGTQVAITYSFYDDVNRQISRVSAEGYLTEYAYDAVGNQISNTLFDEPVTVLAGQLPVPQVGDAGRTETMTYDAVNRLVRETSPLGVHRDYQYDDRGNRTAMIDAAGSADARTTQYAYDKADRLVSTTDALGVISQMTLDANGNVVERRDALGTPDERLTTYIYDGNNRVINMTDALGVVTATAYDANGNVISQTEAAGLAEERTQTFEYDRNNRQIAEVNGEGERSESIYDGAGNRIELILAPGLPDHRSNSFEFDRDNRLIAVIDGEGVRTEYRYDGQDNKLETIQAAGIAGEERHSYYTYDLDSRLVEITDPMGAVTQYTYDVLGNQTQIVNANGGIQTNEFDAIGRLVSSLSAGDVLTAHSYDLRGNIISTTQSFADGTDARTTTYGYDLLDQQTLITDPEGFSTSIAYDAFGNQIEVTHGQYLPQAADPDYDAAKAALAFVQSNQFSYDAANRLLSLTDGEGNVVAYSYDAVGNRISMTEAANTAPRTTHYLYDLANRLVETQTPEGGISRNSYDETGLRISESVLQSDDGVTQIWSVNQFEYDENARMSAQVDSYGVRTEYEFDALGNTTASRMAAGTIDERVTRMEYDLNNRVSAEIDGEGHRTEFVYDSLGNRIQATDALGRVARFYFDGANNLTHILDAEGYINQFSYDSAGNRVGETIYMTRYSGSVDNFVPPLATSDASDRTFSYTFDGNSRVISQTSSDGSVTESHYDASGNLIQERMYANTAAPRDLFYQYDLNNRLVHFTDVEGTITTFTYDGANNKTSEAIISATDPNAIRETVYTYDLNNRVISEVFDPTGLNLVQTMSYDLAGNVIAQVDANDNLRRAEYDLNNRMVRQIDALGNDTLISYDAVGNQVAVTDANGNTTEWIYDDNNRAVEQIMPEVTVFTIDGGSETIRPTIIRTFDAAGNETQVVDAAGFTTTRYFDSNNRLVAEINGDNVLKEWAFNSAGEQVSETLYMTRLSAAAHDPSVYPASPSGEARTTSYEYDLGGRVTRMVYPQIEVTTLSGTESGSPTYSQALVNPEETFIYDAFGNQIEAVDANGNSVLSFFDTKGRVIAKVDGEGYLIEYEYDAQDNVLEERIYAEPLDLTQVVAGELPSVPAGVVHETSRVYDAASRMVEERSPLVEIFDPSTLATTQERVVTLYSYDGVGNETSKTLAAGTTQEFTEYSYYDAVNNQIAVIDGKRVVNLFSYDANGNQTQAKRLFTAVGAAVDLTALNGNTDFAALVGSDTNDQTLTRLYDALNRLSSETDLMGAGSVDDLKQQFGYDANGNRTRAEDEDGFVQQFSVDALGNMVKSIGPDGSGTVYEFDAAGNQILAFTGQLDSLPAPASSFTGTLNGDGLEIGWSIPEGSNVQSYLVFDQVSRSNLDDYANKGTVQGTWYSTEGAYTIPADQLGSGDEVYYRVVTQDAAGSLTWSSEQVLTVPPRLGDVSVSQTGPNSLEVVASFDAGALNPSLFYGMSGAANTEVVMQDLGNGEFKATLNGINNPQELVYQFSWEDSTGAVYNSTETPFESSELHAGISTQLTESAVIDGTDTFYKLHMDTTLSDELASDLLTLAARWERTDIADGATGSLSVEG